MHISMTRIQNTIPTYPGAGQVLMDMLEREMNNVNKGEARVMERRLTRLVSTWDHVVPFYVEVNAHSGFMDVTIWTDDMIFYFMDQGTSIRYATMTEDFEPKTTPGSLKSGFGRGGLAYVNPNYPKPGIQARAFMSTLYYEREEPYFRKMNNAFTRVLNRWWRSGGE